MAVVESKLLRPLNAALRAGAVDLEFIGKRGRREKWAVFVRHVTSDVTRMLTLPPLSKKLEARHSPLGFAWGYAGSGPSELARAILMQCFPGDSPACGVRHPATYQRFKGAFIQGLDKDADWVIPGADVVRWYESRLLEQEHGQGPDADQ